MPPQWAAFADWLRANPPDLVVNTGDIVYEDPDDDADRAFARRCHDELPGPLLFIPGNHDIGFYGEDADRPRRLATFRDTWGADRFAIDLAGWRIVGADAYLLGQPEHDEWLTAAVQTERPVLVFVHQPIRGDPPDGWEMPEPARAAFDRAVAGADVRLVASGHRHSRRGRRRHRVGAVPHPGRPGRRGSPRRPPPRLRPVRAVGGRKPLSSSPAAVADRLTDWGSITDVPGVRVGHYERVGRGWRTGTTAVIVPAGATPGVDVRGGGPGTRETDALRPENLVPTVHAVCLTGGSAYGLAAADGVVAWLEHRRLGFPVGLDDEPEQIVPIVPAAVIFDLGRGGRFGNRPTPEFGSAGGGPRPRRGTSARRRRGRGRGRGGWTPGRRRHRRLRRRRDRRRSARRRERLGAGDRSRPRVAMVRRWLRPASSPCRRARRAAGGDDAAGARRVGTAAQHDDRGRGDFGGAHQGRGVPAGDGGPRRPRPGRASGPRDVRRRLHLRPRHRSRRRCPTRRPATAPPSPDRGASTSCSMPRPAASPRLSPTPCWPPRRSVVRPPTASSVPALSEIDLHVASLLVVTSCPGEGTVE